MAPKKISLLQKSTNILKVNKYFDLLKMDLNHKSCPLSWVIVQIYKFDHDFAPFFAPISYHYVLCAMFILHIVIPLIIIVRSENVCIFFRNQILKFFKLITMYKKCEP